MPDFPIGSNPQRWSLLTSVGYDNSVLDRLHDVTRGDVTLREQRWSGVAELSYRLPRYTFFNLLSFRASFQHNTYYRIGQYISRLADYRVDTAKGLDPSCDLTEVRAAVRDALTNSVYRLQVQQGDDPNLLPADEETGRAHFNALKQTYVVSFTGIGDHRDDYFSPTDGALGELRGEFGVTGGLTGGFFKIEGNYRVFTPVGWGWTWASRVHIGSIFEFGPLPLTPVASRFSAGGASSLRGWEVRDMLATRPPELDSNAAQNCAEPIVQQIVDENRRLLGGLALLELSTEFRHRIFNLSGSSTLSQQLNELVFIAFADAGNAYFRDREDLRSATLKFFVTNIGLDVGASIGYNTPVGPFRIGAGVPVYDPVADVTDDAHKWIWKRQFLGSLVWHVGIGHAF
jgi:outer membrane protein assembly factor BamA